MYGSESLQTNLLGQVKLEILIIWANTMIAFLKCIASNLVFNNVYVLSIHMFIAIYSRLYIKELNNWLSHLLITQPTYYLGLIGYLNPDSVIPTVASTISHWAYKKIYKMDIESINYLLYIDQKSNNGSKLLPTFYSKGLKYENS